MPTASLTSPDLLATVRSCVNFFVDAGLLSLKFEKNVKNVVHFFLRMIISDVLNSKYNAAVH